MTQMSSAGGEQERFVTNAGQTPEVGDYIVLLGMHVTTKEIDDWTFQTFWWMPAPHVAPFGHDRPASVRAPFDNYVRCAPRTARFRRAAPTARCPSASIPTWKPTSARPSRTRWTAGPFRPTRWRARARTARTAIGARRIPRSTRPFPASADFGHVYNDGYRSPDDPYFAKLLKVDFMWSIALKNVAP